MLQLSFSRANAAAAKMSSSPSSSSSSLTSPRRHLLLQGAHSARGLDFVVSDLGVPPHIPAAIPIPPDLPLPKQNWAGSGMSKSESTESSL